MEKKDILKDVDIEEVISELRAKALKTVAVKHMEIKENEVEDMEDDSDDDNQFKRKIMIKWRNKDIKNNKPRLANILWNARIMSKKAIRDKLGPYELTAIPLPKPSNEPILTHSELGWLVDEITMANMEIMAYVLFGLTDVEVSNIKANKKKDNWGARFQILVDGCIKAETTRQELLRFIQTNGIGNQDNILEILGDGGASQTPPPEAPSPGPSSEVHSISQALTINGNPPEPKDPLGRTDSLVDGREPDDPAQNAVQHDNYWNGTPLARFEDLERYDWLKFKEIIKITEKVEKTTKTVVVVAVLDTGIWEEHPRLKRKIIAKKSYCVLKEAEEDLREDYVGHGTMVAGVIALNGPVNVKILNIKLADMNDAEVLAALRYIEELDGTLDEVDIINMSFDCPANMSDALDEKIKKMSSRKIIIAAAGNDGATKSDPVSWIHPNVICVGACSKDGIRCDFSPDGPQVVVLCPGKEVATTWTAHCQLEKDKKHKGEYTKIDGTSFAAPHASAIAAHLLVTIEALTYLKTKKCLDAGAKTEANINNAKKEAKWHRRALRNTEKMRVVLKGMADGHGGVLRPYENCFKDQTFDDVKEEVFFGNKSWTDFYKHCEKANIFERAKELKKAEELKQVEKPKGAEESKRATEVDGPPPAPPAPPIVIKKP